MENYFTTAQVAEHLHVSSARVRKLIDDGRLPAEKHGRDYIFRRDDVERFARQGRKTVGRPKHQTRTDETIGDEVSASSPAASIALGGGQLHIGDCLKILPSLEPASAQVIIADPPYFQVLDETWDRQWRTPDDYLDFTMRWVAQCRRVLRDDGLLYIFGQPGKREHIWLHACSMLSKAMAFHDLIIWDRAVGYNARGDSFTPQYEMILALRASHDAKPYFDKDAVRIAYSEQTIQTYLRDRRYRDKDARERHLRRGKYATNILRVPSLKGSSKEKVGHPSQKPLALIDCLVRSSSRQGDVVLDPFLGSGTTAESAQRNRRRWIGIECDRDYAAVAKRRIEALGGVERRAGARF
ncbi:MAG: DNA methyltransferase [bacterium]